ncbi:hypothetical protein U9M48_038026 [Paspalum notatum var. saurae]|uniref:Reverse transcriptase domain-containing protein n=1 Tax=Paspalum notatum var. saurae TaxID=547442 RepID=A0AAQ3XB94_PASNO
MLVGVNLATLDIGSIDEGDFFVKFKIRCKKQDFISNLVLVYGPAQEDHKQRFLTELAHLSSKETIPTVIGGDFNIMRGSHEKNKGTFNNRWPLLFNAVIDAYNLRELELSGRQFTWANNLADQTFEKLDRVLVTTEWESKYPKATVQALSREISDHTPLLLNSQDGASFSSHHDFKFELGWLLHEGFFDMVKDIWTSTDIGDNPMDRWQAKIRRLRQHLRGWAKNIRGTYKQEKKLLLNKLDELDKKSEHTHLEQNELNIKHALHEKLALLLREEEIKWYQRAKVKNLLEGDANTKYFHLVANGKHRKTRIFSLEQVEGIITGDVELRNYITKYYKNLFGHPETSDVVLDENRIDDIPQVSPQENELITSPFTSEEVRAAIFQMEHNKSPGPDGFPPEFYQVFWNIIEPDLMALFAEFHKGTLALNRLNFGNIILVPKVGDANKIQQYRPICLLNVSFKIFTKVATNRIITVVHKIIRPSQTAFLPGKNIMEGAVVLHETLHELHRKKLNGVIFKIDFEKTYDKVHWDFLQQTLRMKGFSNTWCDWIKSFIQEGNVAINVNGQNGAYFQTRKGLRQGDPLSPIFFNIVADMVAIIINRAKGEGKVNGVIPHLVDDGLSILQYADDTIIFLDHNLEMARNMKALLCMFEKLSGLKINFHKSEIFYFGQAKECEQNYSELFGCRSGSLPFRYLGLPMHYRKLGNSDWKHIEDRFEQRLSGWKGKLLSISANKFSTIPMFMLSFFAIPKGVLKKLEYFRKRFFWQNDQHKKKYHLIKWDQIRQPKEQGSLGIIDLEIQNKCLLSKWLFKLANEEGMWQSLIRNKYLQSKPLGSGTKKPGVSNFWAGIMEVKELFLSLGSFNIGDGTQIRFWEDNWCGNQPLKFSYPSLFNIATKKGTTVAEVMSSSPLNIYFRRGLHGERLLAWNELIRRVMNLELSEGRDVFRWGLNKTGVFSVRSMYKHLINNGLKVSQEIWRTRIPLKTKIFMWYIKRGVLLTKNNLSRRNWYGAAALIWAIWLQRNDCVLFRGTFWLRQWAKLQRNEDQDWLLLGAQRLETASLQVFNSFGWNRCAEELYGYSASEAVGQDITRLIIVPGDIPALNKIIGNVFTGKCWRGKFPVRNKSGDRFFVVADATPLCDDDGRFVGLICLADDTQTMEELIAPLTL